MLRFLIAAAHLALGMCRIVRFGTAAKVDDVVLTMRSEESHAFARRPDPSEWQARFDHVIEYGKTAGCTASVWFCCHSGGLGSVLWNLVNALEFAVYEGTGIVWKGDRFLPNHVPKYLDLGMHVPVCPSPERWGGFSQASRFASMLRYVDYQYASALRRFLVQKVWVLTGNTTARVSAELATLDLDLASGSYFGVHVRRGSWGQEPRIETAKYVEAIVTAKSVYPDVKNVYLASDDPSALVDIQAALGPGMVVKQAPGRVRTYPGDDSHLDDELQYSVVRNMEVFRKAKVFIGTATSNMDSVVHFVRDAETALHDVSLDSDWLAKPGG